jgi:hypothetical protein
MIMITIIFICMLLHGWVYLASGDALGWLGEDDACYYYKIAKNFAEGKGFSFDGVGETNGFHPLWLFVLVPIYVIFPGSLTSPVEVAFKLQWVMYLLSALLLYDVLRLRLGRRVAFLSTAFFLSMPLIAMRMFSGLETALAVLLCVSSIRVYMGVISRQGNSGVTLFGALGLLLGLCGLARLECCLLAVVICFSILLYGRFELAKRLNFFWIVSLTSGLLVLIYLSWSWAKFGSPTPVSGQIKRMVTWQITADRIANLSSQDIFGLIFDLFRMPSPMDDYFWSRGISRFRGLWYGSPLLLYLVLIGPALYRGTRKRLGGLCIIPIFALSQIVLEKVFFSPLAEIPDYYFVSSYIAIPTAFGVLFSEGMRSFRKAFGKGRRRIGGFVVLIIVLAFLGHDVAISAKRGLSRMFNPEPRIGSYHSFYLASQYLRKNVPENAVVGSWNAGIIGYFSNRHVVNLDGFANSFNFYQKRFVEKRPLEELLELYRISYLVDARSSGKEPHESYNLDSNWTLIHRYISPNPDARYFGGFCVYLKQESSGRVADDGNS